MDVLRHHRSLALLIFVLAYFSQSSSEHPHRHHHGFRHRRDDHPSYYYYENDQYPEYGDWGPWHPVSECTRSCGGGVTFEVRECNSLRTDGTPSCLGSNKRYQSCNIHDCPDSDPDFRAYQCALFDSQVFENQRYSWVPYTKSPHKCELNCMPRGERFYYRQKKQVIDGTLCDDEGSDICVNGKCQPVGCDRLLGSPAREDRCRVCGGNGSSCITTRGILDKNDLQMGYNDLLLIPAGATNLRIRELQRSNNYLAIRNLSGHYYLNGDWKIDVPKPLKIVGTIFHYEIKPAGFLGVESITALGPITESLYIVLLYQETNTGIEYEYSIRNGSVLATDPDSYRWLYDDFSNCSATCGGGFKVRNVWCAKRRDLNKPVSTDLCDPALEPIRNQTCGTEPCPPAWEYSEWSNCSRGCGPNGTQNRTVQCKQIVSHGEQKVVDNHICTARLGEPENVTQSCNKDLPCPKWYIGPWKACNKLCGDGVHRREVRCYYRIDGKISITQDSSCPDEKPPAEKPCFIRPCEGVEWILSQWSGCDDKCDASFETRRPVCANIEGKIYPNEFCKHELPELVRNCTAPACEYQWYATQWSECSSKCAAGFQTRTVFCGALKNGTVASVNETLCDASKKYATEQNCTGTGVCKGDWFAGPWSRCSVTCGGGTMTRKVLCMLGNSSVSTENCDPSQIVFSREECNQQACGADQIIPVEPTVPINEGSEDEVCEDEGGLILMTPTSSMRPVAQTTPKTSTGSTETQSGRRRRQATEEPRSTDINTTTKSSEDGNSTSTESNSDVNSSTTDSTSEENSSSTESNSSENTSLAESTPNASPVSTETTQVLSTSTEGSTVPESTEGTSSTTGGTSIGASAAESTITETMPTTLTTTESGELTDSTMEIDIDSTTPTETSPYVKIEMTTKRRCSGKRKKPKCESSEFGCCVDGATFATGPFGAGCPAITTCKETTYGCCPDDVSPADGLNFKGCPKQLCNETLFGCCPDGESAASGNDFEGCVIIQPTLPPPTCETSDYGCCPDGQTAATGPDQRGCSMDCIEGSGDCSPCNATTYGCCPDSDEPASGPDYAGCDSTDSSTVPSTTMTEETPGYSSTEPSCDDCESTSGKEDVDMGCHATIFGCCFDNSTAATGPDYDGCACESTPFGCCPDKFTRAPGHDGERCPCYSYPFGCCPDGISKAKGPNYEGCACEELEFGCCGDGMTPAQSADRICGCEASKYGCCLDGVSAATGTYFAGCPEGPINPTEACAKPKDNGPCREFAVKWFFDTEYGGCSRFWYGGCEGNANRFKTQDECKNTCVEPPGQDACFLPKIKGPCDSYVPSWYYDSSRKQCGQFIYGGCLGNNNRFATFNDCEKQCILPDRLGPCDQPVSPGPCKGNFTRWHFDKEQHTCVQFTYGGCKGNKNNFLNELSCQQQCVQAQNHQECSLPKQEGNCTERQIRWFFNSTENQCMPFYYTGCGGNENNFKTRVLCDKFCPRQRQSQRQGSPPQVDRSVETYVEVAEGRHVVFRCIATGSPKPAIHYQRDGVIIDRSSGRYRLIDGVLEIAQAHKTDSGAYICVADNGIGEPASLEFKLNVRGGIPQIDQNVDSDIEADEGGYITLRCIAHGNPRPVIMWQKGSTIIDRSSGRYKLTDGVLQIVGLRTDDAGLYTCIARNGADEAATKDYRLNIRGQRPEFDESVQTEFDLEEGNYATLRCIVFGNPKPSTFWQTASAVINRSGGRYKLSDDTLQIVGLQKNDSGVYNCIAETSGGQRAYKQYTLTVRDGVPRSAKILEDAEPNVTVTLQDPFVLECYAYGYPSPNVTWWKETKRIPRNSDQYEQRDRTLVIHRVTLRLLGPYTCQAYNGQGRAVSWTTNLRAIGSVETLQPEDYAYIHYLIPDPQVVTNVPVTPPYYPPTTTELATTGVHTVPVQTSINMSQTTFANGADVSIPCIVDGYPTPQVTWYKNNEGIERNPKIVITEPNVLLIRNAEGDDSGEYKCTAVNSFGQSFSSVTIVVESTYIHPNCSDNQFFANCDLIVAGKYCRHKYYGQFCCRSCTLAGHLPSFGDHLYSSLGDGRDGSRSLHKRSVRDDRDLVKH